MFLEQNNKASFSIEQIAEVAHGANRAFCISTGDNSQVEWKDAPEWQKKSAVEGVQFVIDNFDTVTPSLIYTNWAKSKIADGWVYGPEKDADKRTHPCLAGCEHLPKDQIQKDFLFIAVVKSFF